MIELLHILSMGAFGFVLGSLLVFAFKKDWDVPRRGYGIVLLCFQLAGIVVLIVSGHID
jgi:uncharacterized membrane protein SpoIIM required for sporulation